MKIHVWGEILTCSMPYLDAVGTSDLKWTRVGAVVEQHPRRTEESRVSCLKIRNAKWTSQLGRHWVLGGDSKSSFS